MTGWWRTALRKTKRKLRPPRRLRLTREGRYFVAITIGIGLAAINTGNNLLYLLLGWMLSMIVASGILSESTLRKLRVSRRPPQRLFANTPFLMEVSVENPGQRIASYSVEIEDIIDDKPIDKRCYFLKVPAGKKQSTCYQHMFPRRGRYEFDGARIATRFPFGLFAKSRTFDLPSEVVVLPEIKKVRLPSPRARNMGEVTSGRVGRRGEFFGLREYRQDDDQRSVHWRSSAKAGRLLVREYEEEAQRRATIALESAFSGPVTEEDKQDFEESVSLAASLASAYAESGYEVSLVTRDKRLPFSTGQRHLFHILRVLALIETTESDKPLKVGSSRNCESILVATRRQDDMGVAGAIHHKMRPNA